MPYDYQIDKNERYVFVKGWGKIEPDDLLRHFEQLFEEPSLPIQFRQLVDLRKVTAYNIFFKDAQDFKDICNRYKKKIEGARIAVVADTDNIFGISRMMEAITNDVINIRSFKDMDQAKKFLDKVN